MARGVGGKTDTWQSEAKGKKVSQGEATVSTAERSERMSNKSGATNSKETTQDAEWVGGREAERTYSKSLT